MKEKGNKSYIFDVLIAVVLSMIITLLMIVVFSLVLNFFDVPAGVIIPINQGIKFGGVFCGVMIALSGKSMGFLKGGIAGALAILLLFLTFSGIGGSVVFTKATFFDLVTGFIVGVIAGVLAVNIKKERKS